MRKNEPKDKIDVALSSQEQTRLHLKRGDIVYGLMSTSIVSITKIYIVGKCKDGDFSGGYEGYTNEYPGGKKGCMHTCNYDAIVRTKKLAFELSVIMNKKNKSFWQKEKSNIDANLKYLDYVIEHPEMIKIE